MYRIQIYDDRTTGMHWQLQKVGARHGALLRNRHPYASLDFPRGDPVFTSPPLRRCPTASMNFCSPLPA
jgi:hypothetical protein